jgi:hypothetical protein
MCPMERDVSCRLESKLIIWQGGHLHLMRTECIAPAIGGASLALNAGRVCSLQDLCRVRNQRVTKAIPLTQCAHGRPSSWLLLFPACYRGERKQTNGTGRHCLYSSYTHLHCNLRRSLCPHAIKTRQKTRFPRDDLSPPATLLLHDLFVFLGQLVGTHALCTLLSWAIKERAHSVESRPAWSSSGRDGS